MINHYFYDVVSRLTLDDLTILGILSEREANATFKSIKNKTLLELSKLSEATYRKTIYRLAANLFIESVTGNKEHSWYITKYGDLALQKSLESEEIE